MQPPHPRMSINVILTRGVYRLLSPTECPFAIGVGAGGGPRGRWLSETRNRIGGVCISGPLNGDILDCWTAFARIPFYMKGSSDSGVPVYAILEACPTRTDGYGATGSGPRVLKDLRQGPRPLYPRIRRLLVHRPVRIPGG